MRLKKAKRQTETHNTINKLINPSDKQTRKINQTKTTTKPERKGLQIIVKSVFGKL